MGLVSTNKLYEIAKIWKKKKKKKTGAVIQRLKTHTYLYFIFAHH
jgi:hypothetical protein